jgi:uracil-DNA glycosylase
MDPIGRYWGSVSGNGTAVASSVAASMSPPDPLDRLHEEIRTHTGCGFEICAAATNIVPGEGSHTAEVMLVGEAPGASEDLQGRPFVGRSGRFLDELLAEAGMARDDVFITNVVKARPPGNRDPRAGEVAHYLPWLEQQLALIRPSVVIPVGRHALAHFAPGHRITEIHGVLIVAGERRLVPWLHPAAALRNPGLRETLIQDARALPGVLESAREGLSPSG